MLAEDSPAAAAREAHLAPKLFTGSGLQAIRFLATEQAECSGAQSAGVQAPADVSASVG